MAEAAPLTPDGRMRRTASRCSEGRCRRRMAPQDFPVNLHDPPRLRRPGELLAHENAVYILAAGALAGAAAHLPTRPAGMTNGGSSAADAGWPDAPDGVTV